MDPTPITAEEVAELTEALRAHANGGSMAYARAYDKGRAALADACSNADRAQRDPSPMREISIQLSRMCTDLARTYLELAEVYRAAEVPSSTGT